jgi:hypothetical protein
MPYFGQDPGVVVMEKDLSNVCRRIGFLVWLLGWSTLVDAHADCDVINLMPAFWKSLDHSDAAAQMRTAVVEAHPDLYNENYVSLPPGPQWEKQIAREREYVQAHAQEVKAAADYLVARVPRYMHEFRDTFPDYRCDFKFYIAPSFGQLDGAAAFINGQHLIIFAPDVIPRMHPLSELKVLIDHETFHIYHHQATGVFGASAEAVPTILEALWAEGLATFVSWRMNPDVSLDVAMLQPGIPEGARPHLSHIAAELLEHLDEKDAMIYQRYFTVRHAPQGYPPRAGYYVGLLIAEDLSARYTLQQLAHLKEPELHQLVVTALKKISATSPAL